MGSREIQRRSGLLRARAEEAARRARASGALRPIPARVTIVEDGGIRFVVRVAEGIASKPEGFLPAGTGAAAALNPFLPYDPRMFVADISDTHVCLLNKFQVLGPHLLIVTRRFVDQTLPLREEDFAAMWACLAGFAGLAFYNGGKIAGASQRHRHLQVAPVPFAPGEDGLPVEPRVAEAAYREGIGTAPGLPWRHALARVDPDWLEDPARAGTATATVYRKLLEAVNLPAAPGRRRSPGPYNLLATREWMMLVPRSRESFRGISVNALGFAGSLLVRNERQRAALLRAGPLSVLRHVGREHG